MNRESLRCLAEERIKEAQFLVNNGYHSGGYYLAGYAIEIALKACILKLIEEEGVIFKRDQKGFQQDCWSHDLNKLMGKTGLKNEFERDLENPDELSVNWKTVINWSEDARYEFHSKETAQELLRAINDETHGVLTWIRQRW